MKRIVIATDASDEAWAAVEEGVELASDIGAEVTFVTVRPGIHLRGAPLYQRKLTGQLAQAREALDQAESEAARLGVVCDSEILEGEPAERIVDVARYGEADLIVVGSHGHGMIASALLGSVSQTLLEQSPVPVMIVRRRPRERAAA